jgi:hypothetical protein
MTTVPADRAAASRLVAALEHAWAAIRSHHPDLPQAVIVVDAYRPVAEIPLWVSWVRSFRSTIATAARSFRAGRDARPSSARDQPRPS